jgi:hypothetical protein
MMMDVWPAYANNKGREANAGSNNFLEAII